MKRMVILSIHIVFLCLCMISCRGNVPVFSDKYSYLSYNAGDGVCTGGIETTVQDSFIFIGEYTGNSIKNIDGQYYEEICVIDRIKGDVDDRIIIKNDGEGRLPFGKGERYLLVAKKFQNVFDGEYFYPCGVFCPVDQYEDSFWFVLGEYKHLDYMTLASRERFRNFDSFLAYVKELAAACDPPVAYGFYFIESDDIADIITEASYIMKIKVIQPYSDRKLGQYYSNYICKIEKVYKGDYDPQNEQLITRRFSGENYEPKSKEINGYSRCYIIWLFDSPLLDYSIDLNKTNEYIICTNGINLIARKGIISLKYTEEEIVQMIKDVYGEIDILEISEDWQP